MDRERLANTEETLQRGRDLALQLCPGDIVALHGELGAGKTTLVQGILEGLGCQDQVQSPTFTYLHTYPGNIHHFDLYRLSKPEDFIALGFEELLHDSKAITLIEWPERIEKLLPPNAWHVRLSHQAPSGRLIQVSR